jgi:tetratricopeptide (TPR) repeat protein
MLRSLPLVLAVALSLPLCITTEAATRETPGNRETFYRLMLPQFSASTLADEGRYAEAIAPAATMLRISTERRDTVWMITSHQVLAQLLVQVGRADSARRHAAEAVRLSETTAGRSMASSSYFVYAAAVDAAGQPDSAFMHLRTAVCIGLVSGDSTDAGVALVSIGAHLLDRGSPRKALPCLDSALVILPTSTEAALLWQAHSVRGRCLHRLQMYSSASEEFEVAYRFLTETRTRDLTDRARVYLMDEATRDFFAEWQDAWLSRGSTASFQFRALGVAERARAQAFLDLVQPGDTLAADSNGFLHPALAPGRRFGPGRDLLDDAAAACRIAVPPGCALIYYSQLPDSLLIWVYQRGSLISARTYFPARIYERVGPLLSSVSDTAMSPPGVAGWWNRYMVANGGPDSVYRMIARSCLPDTLLRFIRGARELVIVPDGWLKRVPFAALPVGGSRLGLRFPLRTAPSLALLEHVEQASRPDHEIKPDEIVVVGDPASCRPRLEGARAEAESVSAMFGVRPLLGAAATESVLTARWPRLRLIHLATHGEAFADPGRALDSYVCLQSTPGFDGRLTAREVQYNLVGGKPYLVFLSACETGYGASSRADATIGLPRAFLAAGAHTVVASLWQLDDLSSAWLVRRFYYHLLHDADRPSVARALHLAMIDTSAKAKWKDPYFWAAFQVVGGG